MSDAAASDAAPEDALIVGLAKLKMAAKAAGDDAAAAGAGAGSGDAVDASDVTPTITAEKKEHPFFHYYGLLVHQQNMLQDHVRTGTYQSAMLKNKPNFAGKVVLDVGTGSGILAFFAIQAGARKVYAVEASAVADSAKKLVEANGLSDKIIVLKGKVEEVDIPEKVDVVISEPMGFLLVHERMLESYMAARDKYLKPGGLMFPTVGTIFCAPFSDDALYAEQTGKVAFWDNTSFYGVNLTALSGTSMDDHFSQPVVGYFDPSILIADTTATHTVDFSKDPVTSLNEINIPFTFTITRTCEWARRGWLFRALPVASLLVNSGLWLRLWHSTAVATTTVLDHTYTDAALTALMSCCDLVCVPLCMCSVALPSISRLLVDRAGPFVFTGQPSCTVSPAGLTSCSMVRAPLCGSPRHHAPRARTGTSAACS